MEDQLKELQDLVLALKNEILIKDKKIEGLESRVNELELTVIIVAICDLID
jgi:hypothetical protein